MISGADAPVYILACQVLDQLLRLAHLPIASTSPQTRHRRMSGFAIRTLDLTRFDIDITYKFPAVRFDAKEGQDATGSGST